MTESLRCEVIEFVLKSVEPGLRGGLLRVGRVYESGTFVPIAVSLADALRLITVAVDEEPIDLEGDVWFGSVPEDRQSRHRRRLADHTNTSDKVSYV